MRPQHLNRCLLALATLAVAFGCSQQSQAGDTHRATATGGTPGGVTSGGVVSGGVVSGGGVSGGVPSSGLTARALTADGTDGGASLEAEPELITRKVKVGVHSRVSGADTTWVASRLERMNLVLEKNEPGYDSECNDISGDIDVHVRFELDSFETFDVGDGDIDTEEEYREVAVLPYDFKVVRSISWCDCAQTEHPDVLGCAAQKEAVVVALPDYGVEPVVWAHEYGHFAGLRHSTDLRNVMFEYASRCKVHVDADQCTLYRTPTDEALLATCSYGALAVMRPAQSDAELEDQLREFVTATHIHGLPYEQARAFGARPHALDYLIGLLDDPAFRAQHGQVALAIGAIGGERAVERLTAFVEGAGPDRDSLRVLRSALPAIGWALSSPKSEPAADKALAFLAERARPGFWKGRPGLDPGERDVEAAGLGARAAMGIAFSGRNVRGALEQALDGAEDESHRNVLLHMQRVNQAIQASQDGDLAAYYAGRR